MGPRADHEPPRCLSNDGSGVETQRITATSGGLLCTEFLNAMSACAGTYGSSAAVTRGFTPKGPMAR